jgi:hypothetical protein
VRLDCLGADAQLRGDVLGGTALGDELQHLPLAHREPIGPAGCGIGLCHGARDAGAQVHLATAHPLDRPHQVACCLVLEDVTLHPAAERFGDVLRVIVLCQHDEPHLRAAVSQLEGGVEPIEERHADVHDGHIGYFAAHETHGFAAVRGFSGHDESCTFEQFPQSLPHEHVVVGEHQADGHAIGSVADARTPSLSIIPRSLR